MKPKLLIGATAILFTACATTSNIGMIQPGMTQEQVLVKVGEPISKEFDENTTGWLYKNMNSFNVITGPNIRYYWVIFDKNDKVIAVKDAGKVERTSSNSSNSGMGFLCKDAISRGDQGAIFVHCK